MSSESSAGQAVFTGIFFQSYWEIIKVDLINFVNDSFKGKNLTEYFTHTCLALIPKVDSPSNFNELRPISLRNYTNKIISKIISNRLSPLLTDLISVNQSEFVSGRLITENVMLAQEIIHDI